MRARVEGIDGQFRPNPAAADSMFSLRTTLAIQRIEAEIDVRNTRSRALVEHLGFTCEAPLQRRRRQTPEGFMDSALYALVTDICP